MALFRTKIASPSTEKVVLCRHGEPLRLLPPRSKPYAFWGKGYEALRWPVADPFLSAGPCAKFLDALLGKEWAGEAIEVLSLEANERAIVWDSGAVLRLLGPGRHAWWKTSRALKVERFETDGLLFEHKRLGAILSSAWGQAFLEEETVPAGSRGLLHIDGKLAKALEPGRYSTWRNAESSELFIRDLRLQTITLSGQELMTRDRATLRLNVDVAFRFEDLEKAFGAASIPENLLYNRAQLALRDLVGALTLDELLEGKDSLSNSLREAVEPFAEGMGLRVEYAAARDVILPGELKTLLNKVIEARKAAEANAVKRREETASTRSQLNTAKLIEENPALLRLKEIEALQEMMEKVQTLTVFDGLRGLLDGARLGSGKD